MFSQEEEKRILDAIGQAESRTSGEIRLFVEDFCLRDHPVERAAEVFHLHGMYHTKYRNAVLVYVAEKSHNFAIWGDAGIHERVGFMFWDAEKRLLREHFSAGNYCDGICAVVAQIGEQLRQHFPELPGDTNELPDEIIYG